MIYNKSEQVLACDVDDTLVLWRKPIEGEETVEIKCPYDGELVILVKHKPHIKLIKDRFARGCWITVWSQSGPQWANAVVKALNLEEHVSEVQAKPFMIVDDLPASAWLSNRVYLDSNIHYGNMNADTTISE